MDGFFLQNLAWWRASARQAPPQQTKFNIVANRHLEKSKKIMISQKIEQNFSVPCVLMHNGHP